MSYHIQLDSFDGPLDLLLFLIRKNEVDLFDIPIAEITQQYLEYLDLIKMLDLEGASDYILMAATLIRIKAKMLLPKPPVEDDEEEEDPRDELVRRLLEYQRFKEVSIQMADLEQARRLVWPRQFFDYDLGDDEEPAHWEPDQNYTLFDLMRVFKDVLKKAPVVTEHRVETISVTSEEQMDYLLKELQENGDQILFYETMEKLQNRLVMIVTFIALLELIRRGLVVINQSSVFGEIWIKRK